MKLVSALAGALVFATIITAAAAGEAQGGGATADIAAVNQTLAELMDAYNRRDMAGITRLMAPDLVAYGSIYNAVGPDDLRVKSAGALAPVRGARTATKQDITMSGNVAWVAFMLDTDKQTGAEVSTTRARWTVVFEKRSNRWMIAHFHVSPDPEARTRAQ
jgi:ketosteroid isomerase-like protein